VQKYSVNQYAVSNILNWVQSEEIAVPEIQRPFVWSSIKVRDLIDSLYHGYPIGYIIVWKNPNVRSKDGKLSEGRKVLIDGQQRVVSLCAAVLGRKIVNEDYKEVNISISFNPMTEEFETRTPAIDKNTQWIPDISDFLKKEGGKIAFINEYCERNNIVDREKIEMSIDRLADIKSRSIGFIELEHDLDIDTVTEIFIRINSTGVVLSQADFAMSKIASYGGFGANLRKLIDYFCHLSKQPEFYKQISENDLEFTNSGYLPKIEWLKNQNDDLYDPDYGDVIRVSFTKKFGRGKLSDLVSLLSGRNFETQTFEESIVKDTFKKLEGAVLEFVNQTSFERFVMILKSAGFINRNLISSQNALNFAYIVYLKLMEKEAKKEGSNKLIDKLVRRWFVMSVLTGRYSGSSDSTFDTDIRNINNLGVEKYLEQIENAELSEAFWNIGLVGELNRSVIPNPYSNVFFAAQVHSNDRGFLSDTITVGSMIEQSGDIHHIFPKEYLKSKYPSRNDYNQIANYAYAQTEVNIRIGKKAPKDYFDVVLEQCKGGKISFGSIQNIDDLNKNLRDHCIPESVFEMTIDDYPSFLEQRRLLMAKKIERYYKRL
jgi:hypothetical protein